MDKHEVARILDEIGVLLSLHGENPFKVRAYHNAARAVENLDEDLETVVREKRLEEIPGIGTHTAERISTLVTTGQLPLYEKLKKKTPPGLLQLLQVPGLGAKKVQTLHKKLKIQTTQDLIAACKEGKIAKLAGFGTRTEEKILSTLTQIKGYGKRVLFWGAMQAAEPIFEALSKLKEVQKVEIAGSLRRKLETIGDLDFLVATSSPQSVVDWFVTAHWVDSIISKGPSKASVRLKKSGQQADLRVVSEEQFPFALMYFTGSKEHNIRLRQRTLTKGFSLSEYGFEAADKKEAIKLLTEEEIYNFLGLDFIPPELREDMGEIAAAETGKLPQLVQEKDIRGVFHAHTTDSDGHNTLEEMARGGEQLGWEYLGISDHSK
ncbi:MAG: helix-hairpin-helix domain-containing protein, partial [Chlamydiales bacterium]